MTRAPSCRASTLPALAQATGWEFGTRTRILPRVEVGFTYWWLNLSSELVFVGDEGTLEPSGPSHRQGFEFSVKAKLLDWLTFTGNMTKTTAEFFNGGAVPLAPRLTAFADLTARLPWGLSASATMRYVSDRYADEDRTLTAQRFTLFDVGARYRLQALHLRRPRRLRHHREPGQCRVARGAVRHHFAAAGGAAPGRDRGQLHARATRAPSSAASRSDSDTVRAT